MTQPERIDVTELVRAVEQAEGSAQVFVTASATTPAGTLRALQSAIAHETKLRRLGWSSPVDIESIYGTFLDTLSRTAPAPALGDADQLSEADRAELEAAGVDLRGPETPDDDPLVRTSARIALLVATSLTTARCAERTGLTPGRIRQRIAAQSIYVLPRERGEWRIPEWQFDGDHFLPALDQLVPHLPSTLHPLTVMSLMTRPDADLVVGDRAVSPVEWLVTGGAPEVVLDLLLDAPAAA